MTNYVDLITAFHRGREKFVAHVDAVTKPLSGAQAFLADMPSAFDLDTAIGVQLDVVGEWVGRSRIIAIPLPVPWFSFDTARKGMDEGIWRGPYDIESGIVRLSDDDYRTLLRAVIAANQWDGRVETAKATLDIIFPDGQTLISVIDGQDMSMTFAVSGAVPSRVFLALLSRGYIPLKPAGVRTNYLVTSEPDSPLFGFDVDNARIAGFDEASWGVHPDFYLE